MRLSEMNDVQLRTLIGKRSVVRSVPNDPDATPVMMTGRIKCVSGDSHNFRVDFGESLSISIHKTMGDLEIIT